MTRNSGKTKAIVMSLPQDGGVIVVHSMHMYSYLNAALWAWGGRDLAQRVRVVVICSEARARSLLTGLRLPVVIDHAFRESMPLVLTDRVDVLANGANIVAGFSPSKDTS